MFDLVVSLGGWCQPALHIRERTGAPVRFFDTLGAPFWGVHTLLTANADGLCDSMAILNNGHDMACERYGVMFHHDAERDAEGRVRLTAETLPRLQSETKRRWSRFCADVEAAERVLFVRYLGYIRRPDAYNQYQHDPERFTTGELWNLTKAIENRWPKLRYHLAFVFFPELGNFDFTESTPNATAHSFDYKSIVSRAAPDKCWAGDADQWRLLFEHYGC